MQSRDALTSPLEAEVDYPRLQDGIYFRKCQRPEPCYRLLLLNVRSDATSVQARQAIATVWIMLQDLRRGIVRDLRQTRPSDVEARVCSGALTCLLGFGVRLFDDIRALTPNGVRPKELCLLDRNGDMTPFPSLPWAPKAVQSEGEADIALQFIAKTELAVNRAVVEVWKIIEDEHLPLRIVTFHGGFNRDDRRSWINFHDGISNIEPSQRGMAIEAVRKEPPWMEHGTYMVFLRLSINLAGWRRLSREHQEILVGRDMLTGCPLEKVTRGPGGQLIPVPLAGCPLLGNPPGSPRYINPDPPPLEEDLLVDSHLHRANPNRGGAEKDTNNRIFRQGYEFLEALADGQLHVGLNFVSFQRNLSRLTNILTTPVWLRDVNFGGPERPKKGEPDPECLSLLSVLAGGFYTVPPKGDPFPGADIF